MKRKAMIMTMMTCCMVSAAGCAGKNQKTAEKETAVLEEQAADKEAGTEEGSKDTRNEESGTLAGVYVNGGSLADIQMGTYLDGAQTNLCTVKMPTAYLFDAGYTDEEGTLLSILDTNRDLDKVLEDGILEQSEEAVSSATVRLFGEKESLVGFDVTTEERFSVAGAKEYAPNGVEFGTEEHPAYYYVDEDEYVTADVSIVYDIKDGVYMSMSYEGPLAEELGVEQVAKNMYDLITVTE